MKSAVLNRWTAGKAGLWLALVIGLSAFAITDAHGWRRYRKERAECDALQEQNRLAARENRRLSRESQALKHNPVAIERAAREELGFIRPGEMVLELADTAAQAALPAPPSVADARKSPGAHRPAGEE